MVVPDVEYIHSNNTITKKIKKPSLPLLSSKLTLMVNEQNDDTFSSQSNIYSSDGHKYSTDSMKDPFYYDIEKSVSMRRSKNMMDDNDSQINDENDNIVHGINIPLSSFQTAYLNTNDRCYLN